MTERSFMMKVCVFRVFTREHKKSGKEGYVKLFVLTFGQLFSDKYRLRKLGRDFSLIGFLVAMIAIVGYIYGLARIFSDFIFLVALLLYVIGLILIILSTDQNLFPNAH